MEELHRIHKDVPFGYWVEWVEPAWRWLVRRWTASKTQALLARLDRSSALR